MPGATFPDSVLVTGGTGFIGSHLVKALRSRGCSVTILSRTAHQSTADVTYILALEDYAPEGHHAVVNLAGEPLNSGRWNPRRKALFHQSRVGVTEGLLHWMRQLDRPPTALVSASAVGWYGHQDDEALTETSSPVPGFSHQLCEDWETAASTGLPGGTRCCLVRFGIVLGVDGGPLPVMLGPAKWGLGGPLGSGRQWWSWIHVQDLVAMMIWLLENPEYEGVFNGTAPEPVRQADFAATLGAALRRPAFMPMPAPVARIALGEFADEVLLHGQRVLPARAEQQGFQFAYPSLSQALEQLLR